MQWPKQKVQKLHRKLPEYAEKTTDLPQVTDKIYHIMFLPSAPSNDWDSNSQL
jgi:hypothetical protein